MNNLLENAIGSIRIGIQDYRSPDPHRYLSAIRNFYAGILLLSKEVLARRFPNEDADILIAARLKPALGLNGAIEIVPATKGTIDFQSIGERFKDLGIPLELNSLTKLNSIRNDVEHKFSKLNRNAIVEAIAEGFPLTGQLFRLIDENPVVLLGDEWQTMLETKAMYDAELKECKESTNAILWISDTVSSAKLTCPDCGSNLIAQVENTNTQQDQAKFLCRACGSMPETGKIIESTIAEALSYETYSRYKDCAEEGRIFDCPECGFSTYIDFEAACGNCAYSVDASGKCAICGESFSLSEVLFEPEMLLCSYHQYVMDKAD